jgi:PAS domain-containing protein
MLQIVDSKDAERTSKQHRRTPTARRLPGNAQDGSHARGGGDAENLFNIVVEASPSAMILVGEHGHIARVNSQTEKLFGYARVELVGQPIEKLIRERFRRRRSASRDT